MRIYDMIWPCYDVTKIKQYKRWLVLCKKTEVCLFIAGGLYFNYNVCFSRYCVLICLTSNKQKTAQTTTVTVYTLCTVIIPCILLDRMWRHGVFRSWWRRRRSRRTGRGSALRCSSLSSFSQPSQWPLLSSRQVMTSSFSCDVICCRVWRHHCRILIRHRGNLNL